MVFYYCVKGSCRRRDDGGGDDDGQWRPGAGVVSGAHCGSTAAAPSGARSWSSGRTSQGRRPSWGSTWLAAFGVLAGEAGDRVGSGGR
eukprot:SAG11_NODE_6206_length_1365_cov_0.936019_1_plen_88_part_00